MMISQQTLLDSAIRHFKAGEAAEAMTACQEILTENPASVPALNVLALVHCRNGNLDAGITTSLKALDADPGNVRALETLGDALDALREYAGSSEAFSRATNAAPKDGALKAKYAVALHKAGQLSSASRAYVEALQMGGGSADLALDLARCLMDRQMFDHALSALDTAVKMSPAHRKAWMMLGSLALQLGNLDQAEAACRKAIELSTKVSQPYFDLAQILIQRGALSEALDLLKTALNHFPNDVGCLCLGATLLTGLGNPDEAVRWARHAAATAPMLVQAHLCLGQALLACDQITGPEGAEDAFATAARLNGTSQEALIGLALTHWIQEPDAAPDCLRSLRAALNRLGSGPNSRRIQAELAAMELRLRRFEKGWEHFAAAESALETPAAAQFDDLPLWDGRVPVDGPLLITMASLPQHRQIQFSGLFPHLIGLEIDLFVLCPGKLLPLFQQAFPQVHFLTERADGTLGGLSDTQTHPAVRCDLAALPGLLGPNRAAKPWLPAGYLQADPKQVAAWRKTWDATRPAGAVATIALAPKCLDPVHGRRSSLPDAVVKALTDTPSLHWVTLADEDGAAPDPVTLAAQLAAADAVITVDGLAAVLAGALDRPTLVMLPAATDWMWEETLIASSWHASVTLFRQAKSGDWSDPLAQVKKFLSQLI